MSIYRVLRKSPNFSDHVFLNLIEEEKLPLVDMENYIIYSINTMADERPLRKKIITCGCQSFFLSNIQLLKLIRQLGLKYQFKDFSYGLDIFNRQAIPEIEKNMIYDQKMFYYLSTQEGIDTVVQCIEDFITEWEVDITKITFRVRKEPDLLFEIYRSLVFKIHSDDDTRELTILREILEHFEEE